MQYVKEQLNLGPKKGVAALIQKSSDDVVIILAVRSPLCKARKGGLKDTRSVTLVIVYGLTYDILGPTNSSRKCSRHVYVSTSISSLFYSEFAF